MKKLTLSLVITALLSGQAFALDEVNPFNGGHGELERLRLETDVAKQKSQLMAERTTLLKNERAYEMAKGLSHIAQPMQQVPQIAQPMQPMQPMQPIQPVPQIAQPMQPSPIIVNKPMTPRTGPLESLMGAVLTTSLDPNAAAQKPKNDQKPKPKNDQKTDQKPKQSSNSFKVEGIIETASGTRAIVTKNGEMALVKPGDKLGGSQVKNISGDRLALNSGKTTTVHQGEHPVSTGASSDKKGAARSPSSGQPQDNSNMNLGQEIEQIMGALPGAVPRNQ